VCSTNRKSLFAVDVETGAVAPLDFEIDGSGLCDSVAFLPDGDRFLLELTDTTNDGVYLGSLATNSLRPLLDLKTNAVYSDGHVLYHDGPRLLARPFDTELGKFTADPVVVADPVFETNFPFHALFTAARDRARIVYLEGTGASLQTELIWYDRGGNPVERTGIVGDLYNPRLSADGRRLLLDVSTYDTEGDIWLFDLARGSSRRLTDHPFDESQPQWSPDERAVHFFREPDLYRIDLDGDGTAIETHRSRYFKSTSHMSPDGKLLFHEAGEQHFDIRYLDIASGDVESWLATTADEQQGQFSPDGNWVVYMSNESGRREIYIDRFPQRRERFRVSPDGGTNPHWSADGTEIYYVSMTGELVAVPVDLSADGRPLGRPEVLFRPKFRRDMFEPSSDGTRFLVVTRIDPEIPRAILVDDWN
jgi:Tol biopolymer transport system component